MSFAAPAALFWLALAVPIVVLYILKVRLRRVPVSTNLFWKQIYEEKPPRSIWQYLRHLLSLLLQLLMLALLTFAVADPLLSWQLAQARRVVLVVDRSASMQAQDVEPTRFAAAIEAAYDYVNGLRDRDEMAIVLAGSRPEVAVGMNGHVPTLRRVLEGLAPTDGPTELAPAIELARKLVGEHPHGEVVVLSDGCFGDETAATSDAPITKSTEAIDEPPSVDAPTIEHRYFATEAANIGITQFQVRRSLVDPLGYEVLVEVLNASAHGVDCRLELELDGLPVDILPFSLAGEELWSRAIEKTSLEGGTLTARLTEIGGRRSEGAGNELERSTLNALSVDDSAWAILPPRKIQNVLVVTPGNWFLQKVFEASPLVQVEVVDELPERWPDETLIVLHQLVPEKLPEGDVFVVDPQSVSDLWELGEVLAHPIITEQDQESPLMTHVRLDNVLMPQARQISPSGESHVLAGSVSGDPIYAELHRSNGRCLVLTVNLEEGDLAFRTAFPIMVSNALGWFAGVSGELNRAVATGGVAAVAVESSPTAAGDDLHLIHPSGESVALARPQSTAAVDAASPGDRGFELTIGPLDAAGLYRVAYQSSAAALETAVETEGLPASASVAVNLANARESDLRTDAARLEDDAAPIAAAAGWFSRPVWYYLAVLACLLCVTEWFLYNRRFID